MTDVPYRNLALEIARVALAYAKGAKLERRLEINIEGAKRRDYQWKPYEGVPADWVNYKYREMQPHREKI